MTDKEMNTQQVQSDHIKITISNSLVFVGKIRVGFAETYQNLLDYLHVCSQFESETSLCIFTIYYFFCSFICVFFFVYLFASLLAS